MPPTTLETDRLILRQWRASDLEPFWAMGQDPQVMEYLLPFADRAASDAGAKRLTDHISAHGFGFWALEEKGGAPFIGFTGLIHVNPDRPFAPAVEIGWRLARAQWGKGYASEAARASLTYGFDTLKLDEIVSLTVPANTRSRAVMERIGMTRNPNDDFDNAAVPDGSPLKRHVLYRKSRLG
ncbi:MAG: GNAT family N-acetyltransferase [Parvibaculaceae bacterium]